MIYVTHNLTEVLTLADWVLMIHQGRLLSQGAPKEALRSSRAIMQIPVEEIENVFTVTFIDADPSSRPNTGKNQVGSRPIHSLHGPTG